MREALLVGLVLAILWFVEKMLGTPMVIRPIVVATCVGAALGNLQAGIMMGASLELVFIGAMQIGAAVPPDAFVGSALGTAFAILSNQGAEVALTLALPIAILSQSLKVIVFIIRSWFMDLALRLAKAANFKGLYLLNLGGLVLQCAMYFVVAFAAILFGSAAVSTFVDNLPAVVLSGLKVAGGLLPAVGFALILRPMMDKKNFLYFLLGFVFITYLNLPIMAVTVLGVVLAFIIVFELGPVKANKEAAVAAGGMEDLFDE